MKLAVITPVGPGHEKTYNELCCPSIQRAVEHSTGPFSEVIPLPVWDLRGELGRSRARNLAIAEAAAKAYDWIFFLDADDLLNFHAFEEVAPLLSEYDAIWGQICETTVENFGTAHLRAGQKTEIRDFEDLLQTDPFHALQMGHFVRTPIAMALGFDESMDAGEDYKYYYSLWSEFRCVKVPMIFFLNVRGNHSSGERSASADDWQFATMLERLKARWKLDQKQRTNILLHEGKGCASKEELSLFRQYRFIVLAPHTSQGSAGSLVLSQLCDDLLFLGCDARLIFIGQDPKLRMAFSLDKHGWAFLTRDNFEQIILPDERTILIHGENLDGDLFESFHVIRWYLNKVGSTRNIGRPRDSEFKLAWTEDLCPEPDAVLRKILYKGLDYYDSRPFIPAQNRGLDLTYFGKALHHNQELEALPETTLLTSDWPEGEDAYLSLLSKTRFIFSYDPLSSVLGDAIAMGAVPVILKSGNPAYDDHEISQWLQSGLYLRFGEEHDAGAFHQYLRARDEWMKSLFSYDDYIGTLRLVVIAALKKFGLIDLTYDPDNVVSQSQKQ